MSKNKDINPFILRGFEIKAVSKTVVHTAKIEGKNEGSLRTVSVEANTAVDISSFTKVYHSEDFLELYMGMSSAGKDLYMVILYKVQTEQDFITLREADYCQLTHKSSRTFRDAKKELTGILILKRSSRANTYWINPGLIFSGDRVKIFPNNVKMVEPRKPGEKRMRAA